ncbi:hypothetical protein OE749_15000 [Aestuariibacter sp. AA17]|uniref:STAS/SEC14 domain-containing protein n=1 Tax=Fluctibacter corallii TaxID=2984329 RepID=A0ABT3ABK3_9ALTE|nr:hypothetical protein [Aestuariibacter sp. AA17]MCV2885999.1 hypothetical protein [Aestuariibacter sp. AA17]
MKSPPNFNVSIRNGVIFVRLRGDWDVTTDFQYLSALSSAMQSMRGNPWAIIVDMRGWHLSRQFIQNTQKADIDLDRRNQKAECWLVDHPNQAEHLIHHMANANLPFLRTTSVEKAVGFLSGHGFVVDNIVHLSHV